MQRRAHDPEGPPGRPGPGLAPDPLDRRRAGTPPRARPGPLRSGIRGGTQGMGVCSSRNRPMSKGTVRMADAPGRGEFVAVQHECASGRTSGHSSGRETGDRWGQGKDGGEGGIRTHVQAINPQPDFESGPLRPLRYLSATRRKRTLGETQAVGKDFVTPDTAPPLAARRKPTRRSAPGLPGQIQQGRNAHRVLREGDADAGLHGRAQGRRTGSLPVRGMLPARALERASRETGTSP